MIKSLHHQRARHFNRNRISLQAWPYKRVQLSDPEARLIYSRLMFRVQYNLLMLLVILASTVGIVLGYQAYQRTWIQHTSPPLAFFILIANVVLSFVLAAYHLRRNQVGAVWVGILVINMLGVLALMYLFQEPGVFLFALLAVFGPNVFFPTRISIPLNVAVIVLYIGHVLFSISENADAWIDIAGLFGAIAFGLIAVGLIVRFTVSELAEFTLDSQQRAANEARLAQKIDDLHQHVFMLATLEHDIRQPIHSIEGYLQFMQVAPNGVDSASLLTAARAANQRANRLVSNLLEVARSSIQQTQHKVQTILAADILAAIQAVAPGLARYYNDPPVPVTFAIDGTPTSIALDTEQLQRAILNLLDNALAHTPPGGAITVHSRLDSGTWSIAVQDTGPGIPASILEALQSNTTTNGTPGPHLGLGLRQVYATAAAHGGRVTIDSTPHGSTVQIGLPVQPAES